jgi:pyruvate dehydrogenase E1 component alpha subunit
MAEQQTEKKQEDQNEITFAPTMTGIRQDGKIDKSTKLPAPTRKKHKTLGLSEENLLDMFRLMYLQRRFEERAMQMYQKGKISGFLHLYMGQEAISTATVYALNDDDDIITAYRDHGWGLARGITPGAGMAELYGKKTGTSHGKGGSMHFSKPENHFWGGYGIVGGSTPIGAGIALANKYRQTGRITASFIGDGAVDQGSFHETMNMAQNWDLPIIFGIENNGYAMGTAVHRHSAGELVDRAKAYGMKSAVINGMDVFTVYDKMKEVAEDVRKHSEPWLLEIRTYRYRGHSMSDPAKYRGEDELEEYKERDPIERLKRYLLDEEIAGENVIDDIENEVDDEIMEAVEFADDSDFPDEGDVYKDVFVEDDYPFHT